MKLIACSLIFGMDFDITKEVFITKHTWNLIDLWTQTLKHIYTQIL